MSVPTVEKNQRLANLFQQNIQPLSATSQQTWKTMRRRSRGTWEFQSKTRVRRELLVN